MKNLTVEQLRRNGNKVRVIHYRLNQKTGNLQIRSTFNNSEDISPCGGKTIVEITTPDNQELKGKAECSIKDSFNRKTGLKIALGRAMTSLSNN